MKISKKFITAIVIVILTIILESLMYEVGRLFSLYPTLLISEIDSKIPFLPGFIYLYISWFLMLFFIPIIIYYYSSDNFYSYIATTIITILIAFCIFILFPTTVSRPEINETSVTLWITNLIFKMDSPVACCLPSMHCALCFLFIIYTINLKELKPLFKTLIVVLSMLIIISTLFIKQHVIYDILAAIVIVSLAYVICKKLNLSKYIKVLHEKFCLKLSKD